MSEKEDASYENQSILAVPASKLTPGMRQYQDAKKENPDCIIMMRMGDFYELFYEDAVTTSRELEITLTARGKGEKRAPLAGIPYHALENYLGRLVKKGYKVAIIEQLEDPKHAKGLVKRGLVRIVTPGTIIESSMLNEKENNYVMSLIPHNENFVIALCDISTGEFFTTQVQNDAALISEIVRFSPSECILPESLRVNKELLEKIQAQNCYINSIDDVHFRWQNARTKIQEHFSISSLDQFGLEEKTLNISVAGGLLEYLTSTQKNSLSHIKTITTKSNSEVMVLDSSTYRNLELIKNMRDGSSRGTLFSVIDKTVTAMGARLLKKWCKQPLCNHARITARLDAVEELRSETILREELNTLLKGVYDLERLIGRVNYGTASPKDLLALGASLLVLPAIQEKLNGCSSQILKSVSALACMKDVRELIHRAIREDAQITVREGGIINPGFNQELAQLHDIKKNGKTYLQQLESSEVKRTGISSLKIKYNRVFGYFIEVTKKNLHLVPEEYVRRQTTANAERFITQELKEQEEKILGAQEKIAALEYDIFMQVIEQVACVTSLIQKIAQKIAVLDSLSSLAQVAAAHNYTRPDFVEENILEIRAGRHPVVEQFEQHFIANDVLMHDGEMMVITGPNMAGKSTIMRQTALVVLLAQMGSFVPANHCVLGIVDRIFTRVGASDDVSSGQSTFMVEMAETAAILHNATSKSLIILDEIGRGTSTFDGVSIAWSVAEYIYNHVGAKTLFATHYHVMNKLEEKFSKISNYNVAVHEKNGEIVFLRKLVAGGTDQSYGIHVGKLAGLPYKVIERAREVQELLEKDDEMMKKITAKKLQEQKGLSEWV